MMEERKESIVNNSFCGQSIVSQTSLNREFCGQGFQKPEEESDSHNFQSIFSSTMAEDRSLDKNLTPQKDREKPHIT